MSTPSLLPAATHTSHQAHTRRPKPITRALLKISKVFVRNVCSKRICTTFDCCLFSFASFTPCAVPHNTDGQTHVGLGIYDSDSGPPASLMLDLALGWSILALMIVEMMMMLMMMMKKSVTNEDATNKLKGGKVSEKWKPNALRGINAQHAIRTNTPTCPNTSTRPSFVLYSAVI